MAKKETSLSELGQYGLIKHIGEKFKIQNASTDTGIGEDASVLNLPAKQLFGSSLFLEGIHFDLIYTPLHHLGYKSVVAAITDILAMNGKPRQIVVNIGVSSKMNLERIELFMQGVRDACDKYQLDLVGFSPVASLTGFTVSVSVSGTADQSPPVKRSTAQPTDLICVSGDLGGALMGLHLLEREKRVLSANEENLQPEFGDNEYVLKRQLKPEAPISVADDLKKLDILPTSMTAVNEGLATSLLLMCEASGVGCRIYEDKIPLHQGTLKAANELEFNPLIAALNGGEDYELMFTVSLNDFDKHQKTLPPGITLIGYITEASKACRMITNSDQETDLKAQGWGTESSTTQQDL